MLTEHSKVPSEPKKRDFFPAKNPVDARREVVRQQNHKKIQKNQERIIRYRLEKNVPAGSNAYLRICYFLKKSQPDISIAISK